MKTSLTTLPGLLDSGKSKLAMIALALSSNHYTLILTLRTLRTVSSGKALFTHIQGLIAPSNK